MSYCIFYQTSYENSCICIYHGGDCQISLSGWRSLCPHDTTCQSLKINTGARWVSSAQPSLDPTHSYASRAPRFDSELVIIALSRQCHSPSFKGRDRWGFSPRLEERALHNRALLLIFPPNVTRRQSKLPRTSFICHAIRHDQVLRAGHRKVSAEESSPLIIRF